MDFLFLAPPVYVTGKCTDVTVENDDMPGEVFVDKVRVYFLW